MGQNLRAGAIAGIAGGMVFGMMMAMMGMLPMIAGMVGSSSAAVGFLVHLVISATIGAGFGLVLGGVATTRGRSLGAGAAYGMVWWLLGPLTLMPLFMGMGLGSQWNAGAMQGALPSLMGHVIYGLVTAWAFSRLTGLRGVPSPVRA